MIQAAMFSIFLTAFTGFFVIVDPVGVSLLFHSLTDGRGRQYARLMAFKSVGISVLLVSVFGLFGRSFLAALGIGMDAFRIAGGLLLFYTAFHMIVHPGSDGEPEISESRARDISVYPLSIPMISGPGALTFTVLQFSQVGGVSLEMVPLFAAMLSVYLLTLIMFLASGPLLKRAGDTANNVFKRLLGILLASLAIQFIIDGVGGALAALPG